MIQGHLAKKLVEKYGEENVVVEADAGFGKRIDIAVKRSNGLDFYEIKTCSSAKQCIREGIGQLLEYSYWPGSQKADRLIIVGEGKLDQAAKQFIEMLQSQFNIPIEYLKFSNSLRIN
ncbi:MAG: hypothetical protein R3C03_22135 [Pirellulaceae bacterium]